MGKVNEMSEWLWGFYGGLMVGLIIGLLFALAVVTYQMKVNKGE